MSLATELQNAKYIGKTDSECLAILTTKNIPTKQSISAHDIQKYLALAGKLLPLEASNLASAVNVNRMLELFDTFDMTDAQVEGALIASVDACIADGLVDATDKTAILAMGDKLISTVEQLGISKYSISYINNVRS